MKTLPLLFAALVATSSTAPLALAADYKVGDRLAGAKTDKPTHYAEISWDDLLPKDWDPMQPLKGLNLAKLKDSDPRAVEAMNKLKAMWNDAPSNPEIAGKAIRIPGFIVPLEFGKKEVKEFLLVPYFGACIHVPPPPANQIIDVTPEHPVRLKTDMDAVWVEGIIELADTKTDMGNSGYKLHAVKVEPYKEPPPR